ncbi:SDR family NAD(P)-dependent oxidoreductase [Agrobacterium larrymoorei]|uniref:type I polyketide synthase n=1 Tax=Agrobacterium larrymoorei TaxID=160699 RepID=UPI00157451F6|nr:type I polyketide synthase [Agrobacterium larrymoorei]NTJ43587.1 SDR family NAD(P)-dependent oxidoreductase [Agrobacterium larrymoorei]
MSVEIIGRAVRTPSARDVDELFQLLKAGRSVVTTVPAERWGHARFWHPVPGTPGKSYSFAAGIVDGIYDFDPTLFGLTAREAMYMDPQQRILLQLVWRALEDASLTVPMLQKDRVGVYVGASSLDSGNTYIEDPAAGGPYFMTGNTLSIIANRVSHIFGLNGPSLTIDTACSSSLVALDQAVRALESGAIDTAIVGGVNLLAHPFSFVGFSQARMLSPEGLCRAYGENGQGYVRSEGGGVVILRTTTAAEANNDRSYARIVATGLNSAGRTNGISLPSREMQAELLRGIYAQNDLDPNDLAFIEGHGTGTKVGDPAELWAIGTELGQKRHDELLIGSIKSNVGHSEPASGMFGLLKAMLALQHNYLPASLHADELNSDIDFDDLCVRVNREGRDLPRLEKARLAGINSFGFGGTNAHVVISDPRVQSVSVNISSGPFMVSAHTQSALKSLLESYRQELNSDRTDLRELVATSAINRTHQKHRFAVDSVEPGIVNKAIEDFLGCMPSALGREGEVPAGETRPAFVFSGNGSQWAGMALDAFRYDTGFATRFSEICSTFGKWLDFDLLTLFQSDELQSSLSDTRVAQALLFAIQASLSDVLVGRNIKPYAVFGHSVGEIAAAYCAGILSLDQAVAVVAIRSRHQHALAGEGKMAAVALSPERALELSQKNGLSSIELAAINSANSVTLTGPAEEITAYREFAKKAHVSAHILDIDYPFHHSSIDREKNAFLLDLPHFTPSSGDVIFISSVTGQRSSGEQLDGRYWWNNVREVVRFSEANATAIETGCNLFIEITPRSILASYLSENARQAGASIQVIPTLVRTAHERNPIPHIVAAVVANGVSPWVPEATPRNAHVVLPPLPFENETLRAPETSDRVNLFGKSASSKGYTLLGWRTDPKSTSWKNHVDANLFPDLAEHVVDGKSILPGSAFLEITVAAAHQLLGSAEIEVSNLEIVRPLELHTTRLSELSTIVSIETGQIEIRSREYMSEDDWSVHAVARIRKPITALKSKINKYKQDNVSFLEIAGGDAYETARKFGLDYGPLFQLLRNVRVFDDNVLKVELSSSSKPSHPYLSYHINPISVDAAFHGLVALFGELTGELDGAPYIPVRFGSIRIHAGDNEIRSAQIEILRFSPHSLKIRVELFGVEGELIAVLDDCRFRRTFLKLHHSLETISFHYEKVPSVLEPVGDRILPSILSSIIAEEPSEETLLYDAAIYRACYDIADSVLKRGKSVESLLASHQDLNAFISNCLLILEDCGLASGDAGNWILSGDAELPEFADIIRELVGSFPASSSAAILVNNNRQFVLDAIEALAQDSGVELPPYEASEATLDHFRNGLGIAQTRVDKTCHLVESFLKQASRGKPGFVLVEVGATSITVSERLASIAEQFDARLFILEDDENLRSNLSTSFARNPWVSVVDDDGVVLPENIGLAVSANGFLCTRIQESAALRQGLTKIAATGAEILLAEHKNGVLADFVFGLQPDWFSNTVTADLPVGKIPSEDGMKRMLDQVGFRQVSCVSADFADGSLVFLLGDGDGYSNTKSTRKLATNNVTILCDGVRFRGADFCQPISFDSVSGRGLADIQDVLAGHAGQPTDVIYVMNASSRTTQHSLSIQNHVNVLGRIAEALRSNFGGGGAEPSRLFILSPGGARLSEDTDPVSQGVWAFARVLQNEYDELDVTLVDIASEHVSDSVWSEIFELEKLGENEIAYSTQSGRFDLLRVVPGAFTRSQELTRDYQAASIVQRSPGRIETIAWEQTSVREPKPDEVVVAVAATGLNFRDVMWSMGMLPEEALEDGFAGATIGMEFSGTILSVGSNVERLQVGDRVMGIGPGAFSTHVVVSENGVTRIPKAMDTAQAATVPVTFLTAYYALVELGRLRAGETVLIHGAAGGVGLAALQIAKLNGAKIIATAGTDEKRNLVKRLGANHVFDSRSLDFVDDILNVTEGAGVDVVINSLFQEAMERSLELVKPFGRFLELGKRDYYSDSKIGLRPFRKNISYFGIDADQLLVETPETAAKIFQEIAVLFDENHLKPLPYRQFAFNEITPAFRLMQSAGHIGKIIVTPPVPGVDAVHRDGRNPLKISGGVHLVIGGIGGFGLEAANWVAAKGASHIALATRSGVLDDETRNTIERWNDQGVTASVHACDVTNAEQLNALLDELRRIGPLKGVIHAAMVLDDALIANLDLERNQPVIHTKVEGARLLDELTEQDDLDLFLLFSSATTMVGNPGQSNYVAANGYLEGLATARRQRGKPALAVGFGAIADTGFLARNTSVNEILSKRIGRSAMKARDALRHVEEYLTCEPSGSMVGSVVIAEIDWSTAAGLTIVNKPLFATIGSHQIAQQANAGEHLDLYTLIEGKSVEEMDAALHSIIASELALILQMAETNITQDKVLRDIGLDSLMAMELGTSFQQKTGIDLPLSAISDGTTVGDIVTKLRDKLNNRQALDGADDAAAELLSGLTTKHTAPKALADVA